MKTKRLSIFLLAIFLLPAAFSFKSCRTETATFGKPNIIVIFTDDQGYADLGIQGMVPDIQTPNLDRLAREGVRMTHGYVTAPQCTPSRAGLISGQYQQRLGVDHNGTYPMPLDAVLLPQRMKKAGYMTGMVGKWHLEPNHIMGPWLEKNYPELAARDQLAPADVTNEMRFPSSREIMSAPFSCTWPILLPMCLLKPRKNTCPAFPVTCLSAEGIVWP